MAMKPTNLLLRCFAEFSDGQWSAVCVDLCIAAQADTLDEVREKLDAMILSYVYDALAGEDREHAAVLLSRKAPLSLWLKYYWIVIRMTVGAVKEDVAQAFQEALPLQPCR